ncbi:DUF1338 domain-containing protein [Undibacterium sp. Jales W-56]|uniref:DUF1338 domain-containing protein n=1 Tax=Undibacterium sp. Jales W-56 TaxID=2897325 RepID=UPI0021D1F15A|nr:DUF1338 domain-containing protein [Undibacterium sp. Jales W-56]MCU6432544.1 DUF1338 domain-containing protein [Undibacterium sp. Jales W-56]
MKTNIHSLISACAGELKAHELMNLLHISPKFSVWEEGRISRAELAQALNMLLFDGILQRVPSGKAYTDEVIARGGKVTLDHGALRTVRWFGIGDLPPGEAALIRILKPLGYRLQGKYPLDRLSMTGRSYAHIDDPDNISQFFVSELHPERFSREFQEAVTRVLGDSVDPLTPAAVSMLNELDRDGNLNLQQATELLPVLVNCFDRQHGIPSLRDYDILKNESAEMAWIATEGNVFNHATDRVTDVFQTAEEQRQLGRPVKPQVEVSGSGRVRQTAFKAATVVREFRTESGSIMTREVPGSFYEFITRDQMTDGNGVQRLDLSFDTGNAQGIFKMTANA